MQLSYRAQIFEYNPRPLPIQSSYKSCPLNGLVKDGNVKLIYRGQAFEYTPPPIQPYQKSRVLSWRFQTAMEGLNV